MNKTTIDDLGNINSENVLNSSHHSLNSSYYSFVGHFFAHLRLSLLPFHFVDSLKLSYFSHGGTAQV